AGEPNTLHERLADPAAARATWPEAAREGQRRFLEGLRALHAAGALDDFEESKEDYIGGHGEAPLLLVQGPPGTGKSYTTGFAVFARLQGALAAGLPFRVMLACKTHAATDVLLASVASVREKLRDRAATQPDIFRRYFDPRLLDVTLFRIEPSGDLPEGVNALPRDGEREPHLPKAVERISAHAHCVVAGPPGKVYRILRDRWEKHFFGHEIFQCLVLDEASQMNLPEAMMAALALAPDGQVIVVGDHRQMPPIVRHDWTAEPRRTFQEYHSYDSLFETLLGLGPLVPVIRFARSFRLHADMAEFLRREVYARDGIAYFSARREVVRVGQYDDPFVAAVLAPEHPIVAIIHDEAESMVRNRYEQQLITPVLEALADPRGLDYGPEKGLGVVVPHRAQRAALREEVRCLIRLDPRTGAVAISAVDTVERFQGDEREVIVVSATESDREYLLAAGEFLLDPRRLTVALSRAKRKMVLVAARSVFTLFSADEEMFANAQLWKNLLRHTCTTHLWAGERGGHHVEVWGN
ncbi:MAG TPA: ATP-binding protein, partial [Ktedonobacterales bacterium]